MKYLNDLTQGLAHLNLCLGVREVASVKNEHCMMVVRSERGSCRICLPSIPKEESTSFPFLPLALVYHLCCFIVSFHFSLCLLLLTSVYLLDTGNIQFNSRYDTVFGTLTDTHRPLSTFGIFGCWLRPCTMRSALMSPLGPRNRRVRS